MNNQVALYQAIFRSYPDVVNIDQMCEMLGGISRKTGYRMLQNNQIRHIRAGRAYRIPKVHILTYLNIVGNDKQTG